MTHDEQCEAEYVYEGYTDCGCADRAAARTLYHYTCDHGLAGIADSTWVLRPNGLVGFPQLVWLTELSVPDRNGLGLTSKTLQCDRMAHRLTVHPDSGAQVEHWPDVRLHFRPTYVQGLEKAKGAMPEHWWISRGFVPVDATSVLEVTA